MLYEHKQQLTARLGRDAIMDHIVGLRRAGKGGHLKIHGESWVPACEAEVLKRYWELTLAQRKGACRMEG